MIVLLYIMKIRKAEEEWMWGCVCGKVGFFVGRKKDMKVGDRLNFDFDFCG